MDGFYKVYDNAGFEILINLILRVLIEQGIATFFKSKHLDF